RKRRLLYGLAEQAERAPAAVLLVEGPTDVLALAGLGHRLPGVGHRPVGVGQRPVGVGYWPPGVGYLAVAPCGTAVSADQVRLLADRVAAGTPLVVAFDADTAGAAAADRTYRLTRDWAGPVDAVVLPPGTDPAGLVARYHQGAVRLLEHLRVTLVEVVAEHRLSRFRLDEPEGRVNALRSAAPLVAEIGEQDTSRAAQLCAHLSARLHLDPLTVFEAAYPEP